MKMTYSSLKKKCKEYSLPYGGKTLEQLYKQVEEYERINNISQKLEPTDGGSDQVQDEQDGATAMGAFDVEGDEGAIPSISIDSDTSDQSDPHLDDDSFPYDPTGISTEEEFPVESEEEEEDELLQKSLAKAAADKGERTKKVPRPSAYSKPKVVQQARQSKQTQTKTKYGNGVYKKTIAVDPREKEGKTFLGYHPVTGEMLYS